MKLKLASLPWLAAALLAGGPAIADGFKDRAVPAPIPVPAAMPVPEGFSYYLRADLGVGWNAKAPSFSESGNLFGNEPPTYSAVSPFGFGASPQFSSVASCLDDTVITGTIGVGAYFTPRLRGDLTLDFRGKQSLDTNATYSYTQAAPGTGSVNGTIVDTLKVQGTVAMANLYWDLLPRGSFTPYIGGGIGFVYNDIERTHVNSEVVLDGGGLPTGTARTFFVAGKDSHVGLAAAIMAGASFSWDHRYAVDVGYRLMYLDGGSVTLTPSTEISKATLGDQWEHQVRVGLRFNIW